MNRLIAVITGGTRGIGLAIAEAMVKRGATVAITYNNNENAAEKARKKLESFSDDIDKILTYMVQQKLVKTFKVLVIDRKI